MTRSSVGLKVEACEDRWTPSGTPFDVYAAMMQIPVNTEIMRFITNRDAVSTALTLPYVGAFLDHVHQSNSAAVETLGSFMNQLIAEHAGNPLTAPFFAEHVVQMGNLLNEGVVGLAYARAFAEVLNQPLSPLPPPSGGQSPGGSTPPATGYLPPIGPAFDLTSDSGMVAIMPNTTTSAFVTIGNGVRIRDVRVGEGPIANPASTATLYYTGWLSTNGHVFDSRRSPNPPATFALAGTIDGFRDGVSGMQPGGIRQIFIPADQGYGDTGSPGGEVPPDTDIIFEVKLIGLS